MKSIILVSVVVTLVTAVVVAPPPETSKIIISKFEQLPEGSYEFSYETEDGTRRKETGVVKETLDENHKLQRVVIVTGSYSYYNPEGKFDTVTYYADETGFHANGDSIFKDGSTR